ncbi:putative leader peptide [Streptomyces phytohabitans]|uniref:putative leader peptide n=1 Tax=Streptomyces phytohabitans TaxID=1150371 RepID=UPI00345BAECE
MGCAVPDPGGDAARVRTVRGRTARPRTADAPAPRSRAAVRPSLYASPPLTSRRHIDLLRVSGAASPAPGAGGAPPGGRA